MRVPTAEGRPELHASITSGGWITISQLAAGMTIKIRLNPQESTALADSLIDCWEALDARAVA